LIRVVGVEKRFGRAQVLRGVSFHVGQNEIVGFVGPNGAGKTTTLRVMTGFVAPDAGRVAIAKLDVATHPIEARKELGYLPETTPLYPEMRVIEYLGFRARLKGVRRSDVADRVDDVCERLEISDRRRQMIAELSKGYRQRVGLADALIANPPVLLLDEPTSGLDPVQTRELRDLLSELSTSHTVVLSTHALGEVEAVCGRVIVLVGGRVVANGTSAELRDQAELPDGSGLEDVFAVLADPRGEEE